MKLGSMFTRNENQKKKNQYTIPNKIQTLSVNKDMNISKGMNKP